MSIADIRRDYTFSGLRRTDLDSDPIRQFQRWFDQALQADVLEPNAMVLASSDSKGRPSARTVLLKGLDHRGFIFFTNYESRKGRELTLNPHVALAFHWRELERQVCVRGAAERLPQSESEAYFQSRPIQSRLGAWSSSQSLVVPNREMLEQEFARRMKEFEGNEIPMPPYWGGFVIRPEQVEFWQGRPSRMHDRFLYTKQPDNVWLIQRLSP